MGLVSQVFDESTLSSLVGHIAIGHCRYSTTGSSSWKKAQTTAPPRPRRPPAPRTQSPPAPPPARPRPPASPGATIALGHNGNLINTHELKQMVEALPKEQDELDLHL